MLSPARKRVVAGPFEAVAPKGDPNEMVTVNLPLYLPISERQIRYIRSNWNEVMTLILSLALLSLTVYEGETCITAWDDGTTEAVTPCLAWY